MMKRCRQNAHACSDDNLTTFATGLLHLHWAVCLPPFLRLSLTFCQQSLLSAGGQLPEGLLALVNSNCHVCGFCLLHHPDSL